MMASQVLKIVDFTRTQKSRYLENETLLSFKYINSLITIKGYLIAKKSFVAKGTFKSRILSNSLFT